MQTNPDRGSRHGLVQHGVHNLHLSLEKFRARLAPAPPEVCAAAARAAGNR